MEQEKVRVPSRVLEGLEAVRRSGYAEMSDRPLVSYLAHHFGYPETAEWIYWNRNAYADGLARGFEAGPEAEVGAPKAPSWNVAATVTLRARTLEEARKRLNELLESAPGVTSYALEDVWESGG